MKKIVIIILILAIILIGAMILLKNGNVASKINLNGSNAKSDGSMQSEIKIISGESSMREEVQYMDKI